MTSNQDSPCLPRLEPKPVKGQFSLKRIDLGHVHGKKSPRENNVPKIPTAEIRETTETNNKLRN